MAGKADILAGRAAVELLLKDKGFSKGITAAGQKLKSLGAGMSVFGGAIAGVGATITTPLLAMVRGFVSAGSQLDEISKRTNISVERLEELGYAAEQTGSSIETIERAMKVASKSGRSFDAMANDIAAIQDPVKQTQKAIELFGGKVGPAIAAMVRELPEMTKQFHELGLGMGGANAAAADELGDLWHDLNLVMKSASLTIGAALAPTVATATRAIINIAKTVRDWVKENKELFVVALKVGVVITAVGTAITTLGGVVAATGFALIGINAALGLMAGLFSALTSPIGLTVAAVSGLAYWFATATTWGRQMVTSLAGWFGELKDIAVETFGGIADAMAAGNLALAGKVLWAGLKVEWLTGTDAIRKAWIDFKDLYMRTTLEIVFGAQEAWEKFAAYVESLFIGMSVRVKNAVLDLGAFLNKIGKSDEEKAGIDKLNAMAKAANAKIGLGQQTDLEKARQKALDDLAAARKTASEAQNQGTNKELAAAQAALASAKANLSALREQAAKERKDKELKTGPGFEKGNFDIDAGKIKQEVFGTFSAAAFAAGGGGANPTVQELRAANKLHHEALAEARKTRVALESGLKMGA